MSKYSLSELTQTDQLAADDLFLISKKDESGTYKTFSVLAQSLSTIASIGNTSTGSSNDTGNGTTDTFGYFGPDIILSNLSLSADRIGEVGLDSQELQYTVVDYSTGKPLPDIYEEEPWWIERTIQSDGTELVATSSEVSTLILDTIWPESRGAAGPIATSGKLYLSVLTNTETLYDRGNLLSDETVLSVKKKGSKGTLVIENIIGSGSEVSCPPPEDEPLTPTGNINGANWNTEPNNEYVIANSKLDSSVLEKYTAENPDFKPISSFISSYTESRTVYLSTSWNEEREDSEGEKWFTTQTGYKQFTKYVKFKKVLFLSSDLLFNNDKISQTIEYKNKNTNYQVISGNTLIVYPVTDKDYAIISGNATNGYSIYGQPYQIEQLNEAGETITATVTSKFNVDGALDITNYKYETVLTNANNANKEGLTDDGKEYSVKTIHWKRNVKQTYTPDKPRTSTGELKEGLIKDNNWWITRLFSRSEPVKYTPPNIYMGGGGTLEDINNYVQNTRVQYQAYYAEYDQVVYVMIGLACDATGYRGQVYHIDIEISTNEDENYQPVYRIWGENDAYRLTNGSFTCYLKKGSFLRVVAIPNGYAGNLYFNATNITLTTARISDSAIDLSKGNKLIYSINERGRVRSSASTIERISGKDVSANMMFKISLNGQFSYDSHYNNAYKDRTTNLYFVKSSSRNDTISDIGEKENLHTFNISTRATNFSSYRFFCLGKEYFQNVTSIGYGYNASYAGYPNGARISYEALENNSILSENTDENTDENTNESENQETSELKFEGQYPKGPLTTYSDLHNLTLSGTEMVFQLDNNPPLWYSVSHPYASNTIGLYHITETPTNDGDTIVEWNYSNISGEEYKCIFEDASGAKQLYHQYGNSFTSVDIYTDGLKTVRFSDNIDSFAVSKRGDTRAIMLAKRLRKINRLGDNLKEFEDYAFYECPRLENINCSVELSDGSLSVANKIESIGKECFMNCRSLSGELDFPNLLSVGQSAFQHICGPLKLNFPALKEVPRYMAYSVQVRPTYYSMEEVKARRWNPNFISWWSGHIKAWDYTNTLGITDINLSSAEIIGEYAFAGGGRNSYHHIKDLNLPSVKQINRVAFGSLFDLSAVNLGSEEHKDNSISVGQYAFQSCSKLEKVTVIADSLTIDQVAFAYSPNVVLDLTKLKNKAILKSTNAFPGLHSSYKWKVIIPNDGKTYNAYSDDPVWSRILTRIKFSDGDITLSAKKAGKKSKTSTATSKKLNL